MYHPYTNSNAEIVELQHHHRKMSRKTKTGHSCITVEKVELVLLGVFLTSPVLTGDVSPIKPSKNIGWTSSRIIQRESVPA
jgi:hypothetical protein